MDSSRSPEKEESSHQPMQPVIELLQGGDPNAICAKYGITLEELNKRMQSCQETPRQMALMDDYATHVQAGQVGRNEPCPCGSGKKYKKCCLPKHEEARKHIPQDQLQRLEEQAKAKKKLDKDVQKGFDLLFSQDYAKAGQLASRLLETFPDDDRLNDILFNAALAAGDYEDAFHLCRRRWQVAKEEKEYYQQNGHHKRQGPDENQLVHFYSPSTWLENFWIASRARKYREMFPQDGDSRLESLVDGLRAANDSRRFSGRQEEGYEMRRLALAPVMTLLEAEGPATIPYLLPLTYIFSWASLFVPDLLRVYGTDTCIRLLAELSMFRLPYFAQKCLVYLEEFGERAVPQIQEILEKDAAFDELKVGLIQVLGTVQTPESFSMLVKLTEHENPYVVNCAAQALGLQKNPDAVPYLEKAKERLGALSKIGGAIRDLVGEAGN